jgi:small subunit ribosomal protein S20
VAKHLSVKKRHRQSLKANRRNRAVKSKIRSTLKQFDDIKEPEAKMANLSNVASVADTAASKGVIHRNKAARIKSRAAKQAKATAAK